MDWNIEMESLYSADHTYKEFVYRLRKMYLDEVHLFVIDDLASQLCKYIELILSISLKEGAYNEYYGTTKKIVNSFMMFFEHIMVQTSLISDSYILSSSKEELICLVTNGMKAHNDIQKVFLDLFVPINSSEEQAIYDGIIQMHENCIQKFSELQTQIEHFRKQEEIDEFAKDHFPIIVRKTSDYMNLGHIFISIILSDRISSIHISLDEIMIRMQHNLQKYLADNEDVLHIFRDELYDLHKKKLALSRTIRINSIKSSELMKSIHVVKEKICTFGNKRVSSKLIEEDRYWKQKLAELDVIGSIIWKFKRELRRIDADEKTLYAFRNTGDQTLNTTCMSTLDLDFSRRRAYLKTKIVEKSRCLITFFTVKGADRILYKGLVGNYFVDEYGHQVYPTDFFMQLFHVDCAGNFVTVPENNAFYYDKSGRYTIQDGEKIYQCAPCTSQYKLTDDGRLKKITKDCGHGQGEKLTPDCRMNMYDRTDLEVLPNIKPIDIKNTLDADKVKYLWDTFGWILPEVLSAVEKKRPKHPIHGMGHNMLLHAYRKTHKEIQSQKAEALNYRADIKKETLLKAQSEALKWKSKLVKRRKPEESDETQEKTVINNYYKGHQFVANLGHYYD